MKNSFFVWLALCMAGLMFAVAPAAAQFAVREVPPENQFFRFKAEYVIKATSEVVSFDLVRPCIAIEVRDSRGDSIGLGPAGNQGVDWDSHFQGVNKFPKITKDSHAVIVTIPRACKGETSANGRVPLDLLPYVSWFDEANDLSVGMMYATEDAYRSPLAKIELKWASIEPATENDFRDWIKHSSDGFKPSREITSPLGFTMKDLYGGGAGPAPCMGVERQPFSPQASDLIKEFWPADKPKFWSVKWQMGPSADPEVVRLSEVLAKVHRMTNAYNGFLLGYFYQTPGASSPTTANGSLGRPTMRPVPVYPYSHFMDGLETAAVEKERGVALYFDVDIRPETLGFLSCVRTLGSNELRKLYPDIDSRRPEERVNGEPISGYSTGIDRFWAPSDFFEQTSAYYHQTIK